MSPKKPNFFIVGAPRSGTTSLYNYFKKHPEVFMSPLKGPDFFLDNKNKFSQKTIKTREDYLSLFKKAKNEKFIGEASHYFSSKEAIERIKKFNPHSHIIIILRDKDQVRESHKVARKKLDEENLKYQKNCKQWTKAFGKTNVHILKFEEFFKNPEKSFDKLCKDLEITEETVKVFRKHNSRKKSHRLRIFFLGLFPASWRLSIKKKINSKSF